MLSLKRNIHNTRVKHELSNQSASLKTGGQQSKINSERKKNGHISWLGVFDSTYQYLYVFTTAEV